LEHVGECFSLGNYILPDGSSTVEGNTIHMAATAGQSRQDDQRDNLGNHYGSSGESSAQAKRSGAALSDIAGTPAPRDPTIASTRLHRVSYARRQNLYAANRGVPAPDFDIA